jgi:hypothetical protein
VDKTGIANGATSTLSVATSGSTTQASEIAIAAWGAFLGNDATLTFSGPGSGFAIGAQHSCDNTGLATTYASCLTWKILTTTGVAGTQLTVSTSATMEKAAIATLDA